MNNWTHGSRNDDKSDEKPPYSRLFIVCGKQTTSNNIREVFEPFGDIEDIYLPKDRNTGEYRGVAYVKYKKTSSAAKAIEAKHMTTLENVSRPIKVMVASHRNDYHNDNDDKYKRLFIKVSKEASENDIRQYFSTFGNVDSVRLQKNKVTDESKGFAYVNYRSFFEAAKAYEECDRKYKPIFATPKDELKRSWNGLDSCNDSFHSQNSFQRDSPNGSYQKDDKRDSITSLIKTSGQDYDTVIVVCTPPVAEQYIEKLCNLIPGLQHLKYTCDPFKGYCRSVVTYDSTKVAAYAVERLNNFVFPSGETLTVKPDDNPLSKVANNLTTLVNNFKNCMDGNPDLLQLANAMAEASTLIKAATVGRMDKNELDCNVALPPTQPMADPHSRVALRCFLVFKPHPLPLSVIKDVFCRFGNLIEISTFPNKTFGFAKYASVASAHDAIKTLHEATINGIRIKVLEADEKNSKDLNNVDDGENSQIKRKKYDKTDS